ncbi:MAG: glutathione S-transferase family protein [Sphingomonas sp.]|nr:glutathione S-transferase family protein [Sphingomonas sp.]
MAGKSITFYDWPYSPFCMKVRAILDYKRAEYRSVNPLAARGRLRRRGTGKVPAIEIGGKFITDSTDIAHALDELIPKPPLLPADQRDKALCHVLEDWADESLYFLGLYYRWFDKAGRAEIPAKFGRSIRGRLAYAYYLRLVLKQIKGHGTLRKSPELVARDLERNLDAAERLLTPGPFLFGEAPYLCDFALWGQLAYLNRTPAGGQALKGRDRIVAFLRRVGAR